VFAKIRDVTAFSELLFTISTLRSPSQGSSSFFIVVFDVFSGANQGVFAIPFKPNG
jgi:hypothetical protein